MIKILIADDHAIFSEALSSMLVAGGELSVCATVSTGRELLSAVEHYPDADLLVMDVTMPDLGGIDTLLELRRRSCSIPALMLSAEGSAGTIARALKAGAAGYVLKTAGREEFLKAITTVASGGEYICTAAAAALIRQASGKVAEGEVVPLTRREQEVLRLVVAGKTTNEIAEELFISPFTAETHRRNLMHKLHMPNAMALVRYAIENGLVD